MITRKEEFVHAEILPCCGEIREGDTPVLVLFLYVRFVAELIGAVGQMGEIPLVVLAVFLECDFRTDLEKWWKEMRSVQNVHYRLRDKCWH
jgi:hypothetical protein